MIKEFRNNYYFLSNFSSSNIRIGELHFWNAEAAFHSFKDKTKQKMFETLDPSAAKRLGRSVRLRSDWEEIKDELMYQIVREKFRQNEDLRALLLQTGDQELVEGNYWHDNYWGVCRCDRCRGAIGKNHLGKILMRVRQVLS